MSNGGGSLIADAVDWRRMLLVTSAGIGVTSVLLWAQAAAGVRSVAVLLPLIAVQQAMFGANAAVGGAVVPRLVPPGLLLAANALQSMSVWLAGIAGPTACTRSCAPLRSWPGPKRSWQPVIFPAIQ
jgi:MFS family permease